MEHCKTGLTAGPLDFTGVTRCAVKPTDRNKLVSSSAVLQL